MRVCRCRTLQVFRNDGFSRRKLVRLYQLLLFPPTVLPASDLYLGSYRVRRGQALRSYVSVLIVGSEVASSLMKYHPC